MNGEVLLPETQYEHGSRRHDGDDIEAFGSGRRGSELRKPDSAVPRVQTREDVGIAL